MGGISEASSWLGAPDKEALMAFVGAHVVFYRLVQTGKGKKSEKNAIQVILLCKRTQDAPIHAGHWSLFGGKLQKKELPVKGLIREVEEELEMNGAKINRIDMKNLCDVRIRRGQAMYSIRYFCSRLEVGMDGLRLKRNEEESKVEGEGLGWFTAEEVQHLMMRPEDRIAVTNFFRKNGV